MQIPRWAAVAVLAPIGLLMIHSSLVAHSPIGTTRAAETTQTSTETRAFEAGYDAPRTNATARPTPIDLPASRSALDARDGGASDAASIAPPSLPSVLSPGWSRGKFDGFTREELRAMADRCELRWRLPPFSSTTLPAFANSDEAALYADALAKSRAQYESALHTLHKELTGDDGPTDLRNLRDDLRVHPDGDPVSVHRAVAQALAEGQAPPDGTYARYLHEELNAGDVFQNALAETLGAERARELREAAGPAHTLTGCDSENAMYRSER